MLSNYFKVTTRKAFEDKYTKDVFPILLILNIHLQKNLGIKENLLGEAGGSGVFVEGQSATGSGPGDILTQLGDPSRYFRLGWGLVESGR